MRLAVPEAAEYLYQNLIEHLTVFLPPHSVPAPRERRDGKRSAWGSECESAPGGTEPVPALPQGLRGFTARGSPGGEGEWGTRRSPSPRPSRTQNQMPFPAASGSLELQGEILGDEEGRETHRACSPFTAPAWASGRSLPGLPGSRPAMRGSRCPMSFRLVPRRQRGQGVDRTPTSTPVPARGARRAQVLRAGGGLFYSGGERCEEARERSQQPMLRRRRAP